MKTSQHHKATEQKTKSKPFFSPATVQPKLTIGQPNDKYEQEADSMADKVMRMPQNGIQRACAACEGEEKVQPKRKSNFLNLKRMIQRMSTPEKESLQTKSLMRMSAGGGGVATPALSSQLSSSKGGGMPLSRSTNQFMNNTFGTDFSHVRVHTGSSAQQMNQGLNARAFTHGSDVYFNRGEYAPSSSEGKRLLAHELTHVVQQGKSEGHIQREELSKPSNTESYFIYKLDEKRKTYGKIAIYYGIDKWQDIKNATPGKPSSKNLRLGQKIHVPSRNLAKGDVTAKANASKGIVINSDTKSINFRWGASGKANRIGQIERGTPIFIHQNSGTFVKVWIAQSSIINLSEGILAYLQSDHSNRIDNSWIFGYIPKNNVRKDSRTITNAEKDLLARMLFSEQRSEGKKAMVTAAWVIKNRYDAGWAKTYLSLLTDRQFHGLKTGRTKDMSRLKGKDKAAWELSQKTVQNVLDNKTTDTTGGKGFYFGNDSDPGGDTNIEKRMKKCAARNSKFKYAKISGTNLFWSNGDYTGGTSSNPKCGTPQK